MRRVPAPARTALIGGAVMLTGCASQQPLETAEPLPGMPWWIVAGLVLCLVGAGLLLWRVRRPVPEVTQQPQRVIGEATPGAPGGRPLALTPPEFRLESVVVAVTPDPAERPLPRKMTPTSPLGHTQSDRADPLPGGWPPPTPRWRDPE